MKKNIVIILAFALLSIIASCGSDDDVKTVEYIGIKESPVRMDLSAVPYPKLSDYNFFDGEMKNQNPVYGVMPFKPSTELFSDYAEKKRFVWMPKNAKAVYNGDHEVLELPVGAALVKSFYYNNVLPLGITKIIETRVMIHQDSGWIFAKYVWNDEQTEAILQSTGSTVPITWIDAANNTHSADYQIPNQFQCATCHANSEVVRPIGIKPQNLNSTFNYADGAQNQLSKWVEFGYLENNLPSSITSIVDFEDNTQSLDLRVRSYFDVNCAHCHVDGGNAEFVSLRFKFNETVNQANMGVCVGAATIVPGMDHGYLVAPNDVSQSLLFYTVNTDNSFYRMPRLGRTVVHNEAVALLNQWINSLENCN